MSNNGHSPETYLNIAKECDNNFDNPAFIKQLKQAALLRRFAALETDSLKKLRALALAQAMFEQYVVEVENYMKAIKAEYDTLTGETIPDLMDELGIPKLSISDTQTIEIQDKINASLSNGNAEAGCDWLEAQGDGALIRRSVGYNFNNKEGELAQKVIDAMAELGVEADVKRTVHHSTLSAYVRNKLKDGEEVPFDILGVFSRRSSKITEKSKE